MKLLVLNYSMNESSMVFSHQKEVARRLSENFEDTFVITADENVGTEVPGLSVFTTAWRRGARIHNIVKFYRVALPIILKNRKDLIVFSHMTEVQSFLLAPWCRIFHIPHFLWYAHASRSLFLVATYPLVDGIITSTTGSCPLRGRKVFPIGQAIDEANLKGRLSEIKFPPLRWYHVGRVDPSKNIDLIISVFTRLRIIGWDLKLDIYGAPSSDKTKDYLVNLLEKYQQDINLNWLCFRGSIERHQLSSIANDHDGFIHAFQGSLDKAVLEAILCKRIVVSINPEYIREFTSDKLVAADLQECLYVGMTEILSMTPEAIANAIELRYESCRNGHTLNHWIIELCRILKNER